MTRRISRRFSRRFTAALQHAERLKRIVFTGVDNSQRNRIADFMMTSHTAKVAVPLRFEVYFLERVERTTSGRLSGTFSRNPMAQLPNIDYDYEISLSANAPTCTDAIHHETWNLATSTSINSQESELEHKLKEFLERIDHDDT